MENMSKPKFLSQNMYVPAGFVVMAVVGGITWQSALGRVDAMESRVVSQEKIIEVLASEQRSVEDRTIRLEVQFDEIINSLKEIKQEIKSLN